MGSDDTKLNERSKKLLEKEESKANMFKKKLNNGVKTGVKSLFKSVKGMFNKPKET